MRSDSRQCARTWAHVILLVCLSQCCLAQRYPFQLYGQAEGLTNLSATALVEDSTGFLWIGTQNGLFRYDGSRFDVFDTAQGLPTSEIVSLADTGGTLLVATTGGVAFFTHEHFVPVSFGGKLTITTRRQGVDIVQRWMRAELDRPGDPPQGSKWRAERSRLRDARRHCKLETKYPPSPSPDCGQTPPNQSRWSSVSYECNMNEAQLALLYPTTNAQEASAAAGNPYIIQAIGRGIGNNAAHELAHQFLTGCCSMDAKTSHDPNAAATYNNGDGDGDPHTNIVDSDPSPYTGYGKDGKTAIHWENTTAQALTACLNAGYRVFRGFNCQSVLHLAEGALGPDSMQRAWAKIASTKRSAFRRDDVRSLLTFISIALTRL